MEEFNPELCKLSFVFLLGQVQDEALNEAIDVEAIEHQDVIQTSYPEGFSNLMYKLLSGFHYISHQKSIGTEIGEHYQL